RVSDTASGGGIGQRWATWKAGAHAVAHRPVLGAGPGRFGAATLPYRTLATVRQGQADAYYVDAHNIVVEYAATTGLFGLAALLAWVTLMFRGASGPLLAFAAVLLVLHLTEPMSVGVTPLAFLALGAAGPTIAAAPAWGREAIRRDPAEPGLWSDLATLEANLGRFKDATRDFRKALRRDPLSVRALDGLGEVALATGDRGSALRWFRASLRVEPN